MKTATTHTEGDTPEQTTANAHQGDSDNSVVLNNNQTNGQAKESEPDQHGQPPKNEYAVSGKPSGHERSTESDLNAGTAQEVSSDAGRVQQARGLFGHESHQGISDEEAQRLSSLFDDEEDSVSAQTNSAHDTPATDNNPSQGFSWAVAAKELGIEDSVSSAEELRAKLLEQSTSDQPESQPAADEPAPEQSGNSNDASLPLAVRIAKELHEGTFDPNQYGNYSANVQNMAMPDVLREYYREKNPQADEDTLESFVEEQERLAGGKASLAADPHNYRDKLSDIRKSKLDAIAKESEGYLESLKGQAQPVEQSELPAREQLAQQYEQEVEQPVQQYIQERMGQAKEVGGRKITTLGGIPVTDQMLTAAQKAISDAAKSHPQAPQLGVLEPLVNGEELNEEALMITTLLFSKRIPAKLRTQFNKALTHQLSQQAPTKQVHQKPAAQPQQQNQTQPASNNNSDPLAKYFSSNGRQEANQPKTSGEQALGASENAENPLAKYFKQPTKS